MRGTMQEGLGGKTDKKKEKKLNLNFQGRKRSKAGVFSMVLALAVLAGFLTAAVMSGLARGKADIVVGYIGIGCLLAAAVGFILGACSLRERDMLRYFPRSLGMMQNAHQLSHPSAMRR